MLVALGRLLRLALTLAVAGRSCLVIERIELRAREILLAQVVVGGQGVDVVVERMAFLFGHLKRLFQDPLAVVLYVSLFFVQSVYGLLEGLDLLCLRPPFELRFFKLFQELSVGYLELLVLARQLLRSVKAVVQPFYLVAEFFIRFLQQIYFIISLLRPAPAFGAEV